MLTVYKLHPDRVKVLPLTHLLDYKTHKLADIMEETLFSSFFFFLCVINKRWNVRGAHPP